MVGTLEEKPTKSILFYTTELKRSPNNLTIYKKFIKSLNILFNDDINYSKIKVIVSDMAPYMCKFVKRFKRDQNCKHVLHITCLAHALHRVCERIRAFYSNTNILLKYFKLYFKPLQIKRLYKESTGLKLTPNVIITRWGSWINAALYVFNNFDTLKEFFNLPMLETNSYLKMIRKIINRNNFINELKALSVYNFLPNYIKLLENSSIKTLDAYNVVLNTKNKLKDFALQKFNYVLNKNPDLVNLINLISNGNDYLSYCPIVSADVERSFSITRKILLNKPNLSVNNLYKHLVIYYYNKYLKDVN
jgi:hypothetical protein